MTSKFGLAQPVRRVEDPRLLKGCGQYTDDITLPDMLWAAVLRSPHVNKKSREQFQLATHKRLLDIYTSSSRTVDALSKLDLPSGVEVEIKA